MASKINVDICSPKIYESDRYHVRYELNNKSYHLITRHKVLKAVAGEIAKSDHKGFAKKFPGGYTNSADKKKGFQTFLSIAFPSQDVLQLPFTKLVIESAICVDDLKDQRTDCTLATLSGFPPLFKVIYADSKRIYGFLLEESIIRKLYSSIKSQLNEGTSSLCSCFSAKSSSPQDMASATKAIFESIAADDGLKTSKIFTSILSYSSSVEYAEDKNKASSSSMNRKLASSEGPPAKPNAYKPKKKGPAPPKPANAPTKTPTKTAVSAEKSIPKEEKEPKTESNETKETPPKKVEISPKKVEEPKPFPTATAQSSTPESTATTLAHRKSVKDMVKNVNQNSETSLATSNTNSPTSKKKAWTPPPKTATTTTPSSNHSSGYAKGSNPYKKQTGPAPKDTKATTSSSVTATASTIASTTSSTTSSKTTTTTTATTTIPTTSSSTTKATTKATTVSTATTTKASVTTPKTTTATTTTTATAKTSLSPSPASKISNIKTTTPTSSTVKQPPSPGISSSSTPVIAPAALLSASPVASPKTPGKQDGISISSVASAKSMASMWETKDNKSKADMKRDIFSKNYTGEGNLRPGDEGYGRAPEGSKTEERAKNAQAWVEKEIEKLVQEIEKIGKKDANQKTFVTFIEMFLAYENISDSLVGILMRAKKRGILSFEGDMLFQGVHDNVIITVC